MRIRLPFPVDLKRLAQLFPAFKTWLGCVYTDHAMNNDEQGGMACLERRSEKGLIGSRRGSAKAFFRARHPALAQRHQLIQRQSTPITCRLRARAVGHQPQS